MLSKHGVLIDVIFANTVRAGWVQHDGFKRVDSGKSSVTGRSRGLSDVAQLPAGRLARRGLFECRDDRFYMAYTLALRRHEAHRQQGINPITPI